MVITVVKRSGQIEFYYACDGLPNEKTPLWAAKFGAKTRIWFNEIKPLINEFQDITGNYLLSTTGHISCVLHLGHVNPDSKNAKPIYA